MKTVLSIAGTDPSGGAGISADLKTFTTFGVYGMAVITAVVSQNTRVVQGVFPLPPDVVRSQLICVLDDIPPNAIKIGMVFNRLIIETIADGLGQSDQRIVPIVIDPIMISSSGHHLLEKDAEKALQQDLFPLAFLVTPNIPEAEVLCGFSITTKQDMIRAAQVIIHKTSGAILIKGGHLPNSADDLLLLPDGTEYWFPGKRILSPNTHGTGCTLSSAITSCLASGIKLPEAVAIAKDYLTGAITSAPGLGTGHGPVNHCYNIN